MRSPYKVAKRPGCKYFRAEAPLFEMSKLGSKNDAFSMEKVDIRLPRREEMDDLVEGLKGARQSRRTGSIVREPDRKVNK